MGLPISGGHELYSHADALGHDGGIVLGTLLALMRLSSYRTLNLIAGTYVNTMRSLPLVLVIFWFFFLVPYIGGWLVGSNQPIKVGAFASALITFTMFEAAFFCEIMRAGIQSIPKGQMAAGYALGLNYRQTMQRSYCRKPFATCCRSCSRRPSSCFKIPRWCTSFPAPIFLGRQSRLPIVIIGLSRCTLLQPSSTSLFALPHPFTFAGFRLAFQLFDNLRLT